MEEEADGGEKLAGGVPCGGFGFPFAWTVAKKPAWAVYGFMIPGPGWGYLCPWPPEPRVPHRSGLS